MKIKNTHRFTLFVAIFLISPFLYSHQAQAWVCDGGCGAVIRTMLDEARIEIQGTALGAAKAAAHQVITAQVSLLIGGTEAGGALFVTDWDEYLRLEPLRETDVLLNDFFAQTTRGQASCNYASYNPSDPESTASCFDEGVNFAMNYQTYLKQAAKNTIYGLERELKYTLNEYCADPSQMFAAGNLRCWNAYFSGINNPVAYANEAQKYYDSTLGELKTQQAVQVQSYGGFKAKTDGSGQVITPGSTIRDIEAQVQNLGNLILAAADNPAEFAAAVASAYINEFVKRTINEGIGQIQREINTAVHTVNNNIAKVVDEAAEISGPEVLYEKKY